PNSTVRALLLLCRGVRITKAEFVTLDVGHLRTDGPCQSTFTATAGSRRVPIDAIVDGQRNLEVPRRQDGQVLGGVVDSDGVVIVGGATVFLATGKRGVPGVDTAGISVAFIELFVLGHLVQVAVRKLANQGR